MAQQPPAISVGDFVKLIRERLDGAVAVARAAEACAEAGDVDRAVAIMLDVEQLLYEIIAAPCRESAESARQLSPLPAQTPASR